jgi:hypothetical protein
MFVIGAVFLIAMIAVALRAVWPAVLLATIAGCLDHLPYPQTTTPTNHTRHQCNCHCPSAYCPCQSLPDRKSHARSE